MLHGHLDELLNLDVFFFFYFESKSGVIFLTDSPTALWPIPSFVECFGIILIPTVDISKIKVSSIYFKHSMKVV